MAIKRRSGSKPSPTHPVAEKAAPSRLASLDAFRGFVILSMIFVNYVAGMKGIPAWLGHAPGGVDAYTFADLVFPGFLFISGLSIPFALGGRMARGEAALPLMLRVLERGATLILLGVMMVNSDAYASESLPKAWWHMFAYLGAAAFLWTPPAAGAGTLRKPSWMAAAGLILFGLMMALFRAKEGDQMIWLRPQWWGILGIIGWAYIASAGAYLLVRGRPAALMGAMAFMLALYVGGKHGRLDSLGALVPWLDIGGLFGTHAAIMTAGILAGILVKDGGKDSVRALALLGLGLFLAGELIRPLHGVSKIGGTDAFALVTSGVSCMAFAVFHFLLLRPGRQAWALLLIPAGINPLMAYMLPDLINDLLGLFGIWNWVWPLWHQGGMLALLNALAVTATLMAAVAWLNRKGLFLRL